MEGFDISNVADVRYGSQLAKQVYIGSKKIWDAKTAPSYTAPTAKVLVYDGTAQELVNAGSTDHGTIYYSLDNTIWSAAVPTSTNANSSITVYWKLVGDSRHTDISTTTITCSIAKADATYTAPTAKSLTYNGSSQELLNAGVTAHGTIQYSSDNTNWSVSIPTGTNATSYMTYWRIVGDSNHNDVAGTSIGVTIAKVTPTLTVPTAKVLVYDGTAQELVNAGSVDFGILQYKVGSDSWSTNIPTRTRGGSYTIYYRVVGDSNINDISSDSIQCSIGEKSVTANITLSQDTYTYNGSAKEPSVVVKDGTTTIDPSEYTVTYSNNTNAGTATVTISDNVGGDYNVIGSKTFTINKVTPSVTAPSAKSLTYNGNAQVLANAGSTDWGTMQYSLDGTNWSTEIPSGTNATSYTLYYRIVGNDNVNNVAAQSITCSIGKASPSYNAPTQNSGLIYNGNAQNLLVAGSTSHGTIQYSSDNINWSTSIPTGTNAQSYDTYWRLVGDSNHSDVGSQKITVSIGKASISPSVSMGGWMYGGADTNPSVSGNSGSGSVTYYYKVNGAADSTYSTTKPSNAGTYVVKAVIAETSNYYGATVTNSFVVAKADITPSVSLSGWTYGASANSPSVSGNSGNGNVTYYYKVYGADDSTFTTTQPTNAGNYVVYAYIAETANYNAADATSTFSIAKASQSAPTATGASVSYGNTAVASASGGGGQGSIEWYNGNTLSGNVGSKTTKARWSGNNNYEPSAWSNEVTLAITKINPTITAPTAKSGLVYNGSSQTLYNAGSTSTPGTFDYTNGGRINAGTQTVSWEFTPTDTTNYNTMSGSFDVSIARADRSISFTSAPSSVIKGNTISVAASASAGDGTITYSSSDTSKATVSGTTITGVSKGSVTITASIPQTTNYNAASVTYTLSIVEWENGNIWQNSLIWPAA